MKFTKMQGAGNDFIIINNISEHIPGEMLGKLAADICRRRLSLGADGLIVVEKAENGGDFSMRFFNSDGSVGEMCGNGARCVSRYAFEKGLAGERIRFEAAAGIIEALRISEDMYRVRLNDLTKMELDIKPELSCSEAVLFPGARVSYVEMGNPALPHVCAELGFSPLEPESREKLRNYAKALRHSVSFHKGANINLCFVTGNNSFQELTFERGVEDFTLACGTGTGSSAAVLTKKGLLEGKNICVSVAGGKLYIDIKNPAVPEKDIYLTGPAVIVAEGEIYPQNSGSGVLLNNFGKNSK